MSNRTVARQIADHVRGARRAHVGRVPPGQAAFFYGAGLRALRPDFSPAAFSELAGGGEFVIVPKASMPREVWAAIDRDGHSRMVVPPRAGGWLRSKGLEVLAGADDLDRGGEFVALPWRDHVVLRGRVIGSLSVGDVVDRSYRAAARLIAGWRFDRHPVYEVAADDDGFMWLRPFGRTHIHVH